MLVLLHKSHISSHLFQFDKYDFNLCFNLQPKGMAWSVASSLSGGGNAQPGLSQQTADNNFGAKMDPNSMTADNNFGAKMDPDTMIAENNFGAKMDPNTMTAENDFGAKTEHGSSGTDGITAVPVEKPRGIFSPLLGVIKNGLYNLATKLGYVKRPTATSTGVICAVVAGQNRFSD